MESSGSDEGFSGKAAAGGFCFVRSVQLPALFVAMLVGFLLP